jgi:hypothetical protein
MDEGNIILLLIFRTFPIKITTSLQENLPHVSLIKNDL